MVVEDEMGPPPVPKPPSPPFPTADPGPAPRVVRLPIVPRDAAIGEGRPLSDTAREHGGVFYQWLQARIDESRPGAGSAGRAGPERRRGLGRAAAALAGLWRALGPRR